MILIQIKDTYVQSNPTIAANPAAFILMIGDETYPILSKSRSLASPEEAARSATPAQINLRPGFVFEIENEIFQVLVNSAESGGDTNLIDRLLYFINAGVVEVRQDNGTPMTAKEVLDYEAP